MTPAGSSAEGCRMTDPDESDFNWVIDWINYVKARLEDITNDKKGYTHKVVLESSNEEIKRLLSKSNLLDDFYSTVIEAIPGVLASCDSRLSVIFPGVRRTGVGIALTFTWMGEEYKLLVIDVDLVPVIKTDRPDGYPHPPLTTCLNDDSPTIVHTVQVAGKKWEFDHSDMNSAYINSIGEGLWRFSTTIEESFIMLNLNRDRLIVFCIVKYLMSILKAEPWYPQYMKERYQYFMFRFFHLPPYQGFLLKSAFYKELEQVSDDDHWKEPWYMSRVKCIILHMCRKDENRDKNIEAHREQMDAKLEDADYLDSGKLPSYFASSTEKYKSGYMAPAILKILDGLNIEDFV